MDLLSRLKEKKQEYQKGREAEKIYSRERQQAYEQSYRRGRLAGAKKAGYKAGLKRASRASEGRVERASKAIGWGMKTMEEALDPYGDFTPSKTTKKKEKKKRKEIDELLW